MCDALKVCRDVTALHEGRNKMGIIAAIVIIVALILVLFQASKRVEKEAKANEELAKEAQRAKWRKYAAARSARRKAARG